MQDFMYRFYQQHADRIRKYSEYIYFECDCKEGQFKAPSDNSALLFISENNPEYDDRTGVCNATIGVFSDTLCEVLF